MMNNKFDELAKGLAQSVTRRQAFKKFGVGLAGMVLTALGVGSASAGSKTRRQTQGICEITNPLFGQYTGTCIDPNTCQTGYDHSCKGPVENNFLGIYCGYYVVDKTCSF
jgi:hypothetical protein